MRPIRVLIVDDEPAARAAIRQLLETDPGVSVAGECRNGREALDVLSAGGIDLVFLDVQMPELDGLAVIERLDPEQLPAIVFVTAYDKYALRAFEVHAVDYLLKPFTDERFLETLRHAKHVIERGDQGDLADRVASLVAHLERTRGTSAGAPVRFVQRLPVRRDDRVILLPVREVDWMEADGDYVRLHAGKNEFLVRETMNALAGALDPAQFARIHRSSIVNLDRVRELRPLFKGDHAVLLLDGTELKLSRHYKGAFEERLGRGL